MTSYLHHVTSLLLLPPAILAVGSQRAVPPSPIVYSPCSLPRINSVGWPERCQYTYHGVGWLCDPGGRMTLTGAGELERLLHGVSGTEAVVNVSAVQHRWPSTHHGTDGMPARHTFTACCDYRRPNATNKCNRLSSASYQLAVYIVPAATLSDDACTADPSKYYNKYASINGDSVQFARALVNRLHGLCQLDLALVYINDWADRDVALHRLPFSRLVPYFANRLSPLAKFDGLANPITPASHVDSVAGVLEAYVKLLQRVLKGRKMIPGRSTCVDANLNEVLCGPTVTGQPVVRSHVPLWALALSASLLVMAGCSVLLANVVTQYFSPSCRQSTGCAGATAAASGRWRAGFGGGIIMSKMGDARRPAGGYGGGAGGNGGQSGRRVGGMMFRQISKSNNAQGVNLIDENYMNRVDDGAGAVQWMQQPPGIPGCPPGLEYLTQIDQILAHQMIHRKLHDSTGSTNGGTPPGNFTWICIQRIVELLQAFTGWETNNKYALKNSLGQQIYYAFEETDFCMRMCCKNNREFTMHIVNNFNQEVLRVHRPLKLCGGCCWCAGACECCAQELTIESPPGTMIGRVKQAAAGCTFNFEVQDAACNTQLYIEGPCLMCRCCSDVEFPVFTADRTTKVGCVTKQWTGAVKEMFTQADNFGITFPMDLDVKMKATLLGAMFLIDFMAFEETQNSNSSSSNIFDS